MFYVAAAFKSWADATNYGANAAEQIEYKGQMINPWGAYEVVIPVGWFVVTGTEAQMKPLLSAVDSNFAAGGNYFEGVADGIFNDTRILRADVGQKVVGIDLEKVTFAGMKWGGATAGDFVYNEEIGFYTATIALNQWN